MAQPVQIADNQYNMRMVYIYKNVLVGIYIDDVKLTLWDFNYGIPGSGLGLIQFKSQ